MTEPAPLPIATPPGWYQEPGTRRPRWWDGIQWAFYAPEGNDTNAAAAAASSAGPTAHDPYAGVAYPTTYVHPTNGIATASLILGIVGIVTCMFLIPSILAVIFGMIGIARANKRGGVGRAQAAWGLVLGGLVLVILLAYATS